MGEEFEANLLFGNALAPITSEIGFIELPLETAVDSHVDWQRSIHEAQGRRVTQRQVNGGLEEVLCSLQPLVRSRPTRELFVPTTSWTAYFSNGWRGTDAFPVMSYLAERNGCRGLRVLAVPDTMTSSPSDPASRYGGLIFELYGPDRTDFLNRVRIVSLVNDDGWAFSQTGTPLPFEQIEAHSARNLRDRFTFSMLSTMLEHLNVHPFDEHHYLPDNSPALLVEIG